MILFAGIVSRGGSVVLSMWQYLVLGYQGLKAGSTGTGLRYLIGVPLLVVIFVILVGFIVLMTKAERRIPIQYAKRVVGRKMYGGQSSYIPVNVNMVRRYANHLRKLPDGDSRYNRCFHPAGGRLLLGKLCKDL